MFYIWYICKENKGVIIHIRNFRQNKGVNDMETSLEIGKAIRVRQKALKMRTKELCKASGVSGTTYWRMVNGDGSVGLGAVLSVLRCLGLKILVYNSDGSLKI